MIRTRKANTQIALILGMILLLLLAVGAIASTLKINGNGFGNFIYPDVTSGIDPEPDCTPKKYVAVMHGTLDLINQKQDTWSLDYDIDYLDSHIETITWQKLGIFQNEFDSEVCLYDILANPTGQLTNPVTCVKISEQVTKGQIEKFPFTLKYNLYDNDCNGQVDDHTFNLVATLETEQGFQGPFEKTVAIVNGKATFQNAKYTSDGSIDWCQLAKIYPPGISNIYYEKCKQVT